MNVLIIGGSSDIGLSLGLYLHSRGYNVIATYNKHKIINDNIKYFKCNLLDEDDVVDLFSKVTKEYGRIDILINMGAISLDNSFLDKSKEEFMRVLEVNLVGPFLTSKIYSKYYDNGIILNVASTDGIDTFNMYNMDYAASKSGLITLSRNLALVTNNKVLCICPNWIDSETTNKMDKEFLDSELKRIGQDRLITLDEFNESIIKVINCKDESGSVFRLDIKGDKLWLEKI